MPAESLLERPCSLTAICERKISSRIKARQQKLTGILVVIVQGESDKKSQASREELQLGITFERNEVF